jgi:hypothetical protein
MTAICSRCGVIERTVAQQIGGRITFGVAAAALGARALKDPMIIIVCIVAGWMLGNYLDQEISKRCPRCGALLRIMGLLP